MIKVGLCGLVILLIIVISFSYINEEGFVSKSSTTHPEIILPPAGPTVIRKIIPTGSPENVKIAADELYNALIIVLRNVIMEDFFIKNETKRNQLYNTINNIDDKSIAGFITSSINSINNTITEINTYSPDDIIEKERVIQLCRDVITKAVNLNSIITNNKNKATNVPKPNVPNANKPTNLNQCISMFQSMAKTQQAQQAQQAQAQHALQVLQAQQALQALQAAQPKREDIIPSVTLTDTANKAKELQTHKELLGDIQKMVRNEMLSSRCTTPIVPVRDNSLSNATAQGAEFKGPEYRCPKNPDGSCPPVPDMTQYIKKDSIPCWNCNIDY